MRNGPEPSRDHAEWIALRVLGSMANDPFRIGRFLELNGIAPHAVRACSQDPRFLASIVDYVADDEPLMQAVISETGLHPHDIEMARYALREVEAEPDARAEKFPISRGQYC